MDPKSKAINFQVHLCLLEEERDYPKGRRKVSTENIILTHTHTHGNKDYKVPTGMDGPIEVTIGTNQTGMNNSPEITTLQVLQVVKSISHQ